jgi:hypothetical protein
VTIYIYIYIYIYIWTRYSSGGIATGYGLNNPGSILGRARFSLLHNVQTDSGAHPASYPMGIGGSFPGGGVKQQGREADHSPPSIAEVKKGVAIPTLPNMSSRHSA